MKIKILPGEYMWSEQGYHVLDSRGFATVAAEECEVEVTNEEQLAIIQSYQEEVRPKPVEVVEETVTEEPQVVVEEQPPVAEETESPVIEEQQVATEEQQLVAEEQAEIAVQEETTNG